MWWRPFAQDGKLLIQRIEYLEFLAAKRDEHRRHVNNASDGVLADDIILDEADDIVDEVDGSTEPESREVSTPPVQAHAASDR